MKHCFFFFFFLRLYISYVQSLPFIFSAFQAKCFCDCDLYICTPLEDIYVYIQRPTPRNNILSIYLIPTNKLRSKRAPIINQEVTSPLKDIE